MVVQHKAECTSLKEGSSKRSIAESGRKSDNKAKRCAQHGDKIAILSRTNIQYAVPSVVDAEAGSAKKNKNYRDLGSNVTPMYFDFCCNCKRDSVTWKDAE
jgi:hypothetical protein